MDIIIVCFDPHEIKAGFGPYIDSTEWPSIEEAKKQVAKSENPSIYKIYQEVK